MGDLAEATRVEQTGTNNFHAELSPEWEIWGPQGGYLASVALRAAGIATERARPASIHAHFVGAGRTGPIELRTEVNRATKVATSVTVHLEQEGRPWLVATVWGADDHLPGLEHQTSHQPTASDPDELPNMATLMAGKGEPPHAFWRNLEQRPLAWIEDWDNREPEEPATSCWVQFVPTPTYDDPWIDAARPLILIDLDAWSASVRAHVGQLDFYAPTIDVTARFIGSTAEEPWLLSEAAAPAAGNGLVAATGKIWNRDRQLVAIGGSTLLSRPSARRPDKGDSAA